MKTSVKQTKFVLFITLILLSFTISCNHEVNDLGPAKSIISSAQDLSMEDAKLEFKKLLIDFDNSIRLKKYQDKNAIAYDNYVRSKTAIWGDALFKSESFGQTVTIPIDMGKRRWYYDENLKVVYDLNTLNYLKMYKDKENKIRTEWVTLLPDEQWLKGDRSHFTGKTLIRTWSGDFIKVFSYEKNGNIISYIPSDSTKQKNARTSTLYGEYCYQFTGEAPCDFSRTSKISGYSCSFTINTEYCVNVVAEDPLPSGGGGTGGIPSTGGWTSTSTGNGIGGTGGPNGGTYTPNACNPSLAPGTQVPANQLGPCSQVTPFIPPLSPHTTKMFSSLSDITQDSVLKDLWNKLSDAEKAYFQTGFNWVYAPDYLVNYGQTLAMGALYFTLYERDNGNANAFRHMLLCGLNSLSMGEDKAREIGALHEAGPGSYVNQTAMDLINNEEGIKLAKVYKSVISLTSAISNYMKSPDTQARRLQSNLAGGDLIPTNGADRTSYGNTH